MKTLFPALLLLCISTNLLSQFEFQSGYVITIQSDTIYGEIKSNGLRKNALICEFRETGSDQLINYNPGEIVGYRFTNDKYYVSRNVGTVEDPNFLFAEYLIQGENVDLFFYRDQNHANRYIVRKDSLVVELRNDKDTIYTPGKSVTAIREKKQYLGVLRYAFSDQMSLQPRINRTDFDHRSLIEITEAYHGLSCPEGTCIVYTKNKEGVQLNWGPEVSLGFSSFKGIHIRRPTSRVRYNILLQPEIGLRTSLTFPASVRTLSVLGKLTYSPLSYNYIEEGIYNNYELTGEAKFLNVSYGIKYSFGSLSKINPYFLSLLGLGHSFSSKAMYRILEDGVEPLEDDYVIANSIIDNKGGITLGVGYEGRVMEKFDVFFELNYRSEIVLREVTEQGYLHHVNFTTGLQF